MKKYFATVLTGLIAFGWTAIVVAGESEELGVDVEEVMDAYCDMTDCACPGTDTASIREVTGDAKLVHFTDPDSPELVVDAVGCARRHGPSIAILRGDDKAQTGWSMLPKSYEGGLSSCDVFELDDGTEALACHGGLMHQGLQENISTVTAAFDGEIDRHSVETTTWLAVGANCMVHDSPVVFERIRSTEVSQPRGRMIAEVYVGKISFEVPDEYDGNICEAEEDGVYVPDPKELNEVEPERRVFVYHDGEFRRVPSWLLPSDQ